MILRFLTALLGLALLPSCLLGATRERHLRLRATPAQEVRSEMWSWPSYQYQLYEETTAAEVPAPIDPALRQRLDQLVSIVQLPGFAQRMSGESWGFVVEGGPKPLASWRELSPALTRDLSACFLALPPREAELVKNLLYNPANFRDPVGALLLPVETQAAVQLMIKSYRAQRCQEATGELSPLAQLRLQQLSDKLLAVTPPTPARDADDLEVLKESFRELLIGTDGIWMQVTRESLERALQGDAETPADPAIWQHSYPSFIDFVLATRSQLPQSRSDYLAIAHGCGIELGLKLFQAFDLPACLERGAVERVKLQLVETSSRVFFIDSAL